MSLSIDNELLLVKHLAAKIGVVAECGIVLPAPIFFNDLADFHAATAGNLTTQKQIEKAPLALTVISFLRFEDLPDAEEEGAEVALRYGFYIFRRHSARRVDETLAGDAFLKRLLQSYQDFKAAIFGLREEFRGARDIPDLLATGDFAEAETVSLASDENVEENAECRYVPGVRGYAAELSGKVNLIYQSC